MNLMFAIKSLNGVGGGAERVLVDLVNWLAKRGHDVTVMSFDDSCRAIYLLNEKITRIYLAVGPPDQPTPRLRLLLGLPRMRREVLKRRPDLVVAFMHSMYVPLGVAMLGSGVPVLASEHTGAAHFKQRVLQGLIVYFCRNMFKAKTVPSESVRQEQSPAEQNRVFVFHNPVNLEIFEGIANKNPGLPPTITILGTFRKEKNHIELIAAFDLLKDTYPEWRLRIVGDGELRGLVEREISKRNLGAKVDLTGALQNVLPEYERATIVAVPSHYESFGMVVAEALACGRPVVGFDDCLGSSEMVSDGVNGLLVSGKGDRVANLAAGLEKLMTDEYLRKKLGSAGPESVEKFTLDNVAGQWERFLLEMASSYQLKHARIK